MKTTLITFSSI